MGIAEPLFAFMTRSLPGLGPLRSCLTLGKQEVLIRPERALEIAYEAGLVAERRNGKFLFPDGHPFMRTLRAGLAVINLPAQSLRKGSRVLQLPARTRISDLAAFNLLGFEDVKSTDVSAVEGADYILDLNHRTAASVIPGQFDLVFDGGTLEHVFHVPNALGNIFDCLRVGGCVMHVSPVNNHVDHGFYQFSPTLFVDYYLANGFELLDCQLFQHSPDFNAAYTYAKYTPGSLDELSFGGFDGRMYGVILLARKTATATCTVTPQQSYFTRLPKWRQGLAKPGRPKPP
jgi:hypothetical protein